MKVSLFITCLGDQLFPEVGLSVVRVLRRLGCEVDFPEAQICCGQPAFNSGYRDEARVVARTLLDAFETSEYVVSPSGSCTAMIHHYYEELFASDAQLLERASHLRQRALERADGTRHVTQPHALLEQRLRGAQRDQVRKRVGPSPAATPSRRDHTCSVERAQAGLRDAEQARDFSAREQIGQRLSTGARFRHGRERAVAVLLHTTATGPEDHVDYLFVALSFATHSLLVPACS